MPGLILNTCDDWLPADSPWRTHEESRDQEPVFVVDGFPVYEVWFWYEGRWWCMSTQVDLARAAAGVVYFATLEQLRAQLALVSPAAEPHAA